MVHMVKSPSEPDSTTASAPDAGTADADRGSPGPSRHGSGTPGDSDRRNHRDRGARTGAGGHPIAPAEVVDSRNDRFSLRPCRLARVVWWDSSTSRSRSHRPRGSSRKGTALDRRSPWSSPGGSTRRIRRPRRIRSSWRSSMHCPGRCVATWNRLRGCWRSKRFPDRRAACFAGESALQPTRPIRRRSLRWIRSEVASTSTAPTGGCSLVIEGRSIRRSAVSSWTMSTRPSSGDSYPSPERSRIERRRSRADSPSRRRWFDCWTRCRRTGTSPRYRPRPGGRFDLVDPESGRRATFAAFGGVMLPLER